VSDPGKPKPNPGLQSWLAAADEATLYLSVVTIGEVRSGIETVTDAKKKAIFESFLSTIRARFGQRLLAIDDRVAERWGRLVGTLSVTGVKLPVVDSLIAATALEHNLIVVTRDDADFTLAGVPVLNPFT